MERGRDRNGLEEELAALAAHLNAGLARFLELAQSFLRTGELVDDPVRWIAFRFGVTCREAREYLRVAEALEELPAIRAAFSRGALTFTKVRALTRVATPASEEGLLELAGGLTAAQLERALRAFRRLRAEEVADAHALEYVDYHWADDGSLYLRARLPAEDGMLVVKALDQARDRVLAGRREERSGSPDPATAPATAPFEAPRPTSVEALLELAQRALDASSEGSSQRSRIVVHVDAAALVRDGAGRSELDGGPVLAPETARRLGCDAEVVAAAERDGIPLSVGRARRTVPPALRRALEARDDSTCRWPGCEARRHLDAHHRMHWAHGGETSLANLVLLCPSHHRLVHEGGYAVEDDPGGGLRFRNRHGVLCPSVPRSPPGSAAELVAQNERQGLRIAGTTNLNGYGEALEPATAVDAIELAVRSRPCAAPSQPAIR